MASRPEPMTRKRPRASAVNSRRVARTEPQIVTARPAAPPPGRGRGIARRLARFGVRAAIAGGVVYGLLVGVREGYAYATTSPRFEVRALEFRATAHVDERRLRELLAIAPGTNILSLQLDELAERVTADPWVARAVVTRELPDTLQVVVEEHEPVAVLSSGAMVLLSAEGEPFKLLEPGERAQLPVVTGISPGELIGDAHAVHTRIARALEVIAAWSGKKRPVLSEIHIDPFGGATLYTEKVGTQLRLGRGDVAEALARYDALRAAMGEESDKLAVAHLDGSPRPDVPERVVASFFPAKDVPELVTQAEERAALEASERAAAAVDVAAAAAKPAREQSRRIPRHH